MCTIKTSANNLFIHKVKSLQFKTNQKIRNGKLQNEIMGASISNALLIHFRKSQTSFQLQELLSHNTIPKLDFKPLKVKGNPFFSKLHCDYFIYQTNNFFPLWYLNPLSPMYFLVYCWNKYLASAFYYLSHASGNLLDETTLLQKYRTSQCSIVVKTSRDNVFESFQRYFSNIATYVYLKENNNNEQRYNPLLLFFSPPH